MKKLIIIIVGIVVVGGLLFGGYKVLGSGNSISDVFQNVKEKIETLINKEEDFSGSIQDLIAGGKSRKCTYEQLDENGEVQSEGTIYTADNKVRTEIRIDDAEEDITEMNTIISGDWAYIWTNAQVSGMKMKVSDLKGSEELDSNEDMTDLETEIDMKCRLWIKDGSKFEVPTDVEFIDMTEMMEGFQNFDLSEASEGADDTTGSINQQLCAMCESAPTQELRDQCLINAGCE